MLQATIPAATTEQTMDPVTVIEEQEVDTKVVILEVDQHHVGHRQE